jgi:hypothetical protein
VLTCQRLPAPSLPDEGDRTAVATSLAGVAEARVDGAVVRDRIEVEATRYDATGAVVDLNVLRRDLHVVLDSAETRSRRAWTVLAEHRRRPLPVCGPPSVMSHPVGRLKSRSPTAARSSQKLCAHPEL